MGTMNSASHDNVDDLELMVEALRLVDESRDNPDPAAKEHALWRAGELFEQIGDERGAAGVMVCLAVLFEQAGRLAEADGAYRQAIEAYTDVDLRYEAIEAAISYGRFQIQTNLVADGAATLKDALTGAREVHAADLEGLVLLEMGLAAARGGDPQEGGALLDRAAQVLREAGDGVALGRCLALTAELLASVDRDEDSIEAYRQAISALLDAERDDLAADAATDLAAVFERRGDAALAAKTRAEAIKLRRHAQES